MGQVITDLFLVLFVGSMITMVSIKPGMEEEGRVSRCFYLVVSMHTWTLHYAARPGVYSQLCVLNY